ncbi:NAD(P)H-dependent oxidoreductase [Staphylococcus sp. EZ-P03]|uniref:NAD(P)H-dependent oxidoreductase n=1 Tax=Staphylococcus sp. EZ-P03 TaxID=2282739 RepID=UPI000DF7363C|nr:NAD(P)H-dependent oxidoreductase [Staphylococcus sp. EZ-P03]
MSTLVIIAHPNLNESTVNQAWKEQLKQHSELVDVHDLYQAYPNGKIDVKKEQHLIAQYDHIVFQYPVFWLNYPPLLQEWFDQVYSGDFDFDSDGLKGKRFALAVSCGQPKAHYQKDNAIGFTLEEICSPIIGVVHLVGGKFFDIHAIYETDKINNKSELAGNTADYIRFLEKFSAY